MVKENELLRPPPMTFRLIAAASGHAEGLNSSSRQGLFDILGSIDSAKQLDPVLEARLGPRAVFGIKQAVLALAQQADNPVVGTFPQPVVESAVRWARTNLEKFTQRVHRMEEEERRRQGKMAKEVHMKGQRPWSHSVNGEGFQKGPGSHGGENHLPRAVKRHRSRRGRQ